MLQGKGSIEERGRTEREVSQGQQGYEYVIRNPITRKAQVEGSSVDNSLAHRK